MSKDKKPHQSFARKLLAVFLLLVIAFLSFWVYQYFYLKKAHSTFANYYAFRGCQKLISKTDTQATCQLSSGQVIKLVKDHGGWYLDGDLATCIGRFCF